MAMMATAMLTALTMSSPASTGAARCPRHSVHAAASASGTTMPRSSAWTTRSACPAGRRRPGRRASAVAIRGTHIPTSSSAMASEYQAVARRGKPGPSRAAQVVQIRGGDQPTIPHSASG